MQGHAALGGQAEGVENGRQLPPVGDLEDQLAAALAGGLVEFQIEGPPEQPRQPPGKVRVLRDDAQQLRPEGIAVEHDAVALGQGAAPPAERRPAQLRLGSG